MNPTILYVDDQQENLDGFRFTFRKDYIIYSALNAAEGFKLLEENEISIVISDQRMPDILGTEFLNQVAQRFPHAIRIILTAFADFDAVVGAINKGQVYRFLTKPWNREEMRMTIENAQEAYLLRKENFQLIHDLQKANENLNANNLLLQREIEERKGIEKELQKHRDHLEIIVKERTKELAASNEELGVINEELQEVNIRLSNEIEQRKQAEEEIANQAAALEELNAEYQSLNEELNTYNDELKSVNESLKIEIEKRRQTEKLLAESETKFRSFIEQSAEGIIIADDKGEIIEVNKSAHEIFHTSKGQLTKGNIWNIQSHFIPENARNEATIDRLKKFIEDFLQREDSGKSYLFEGYYDKDDGNNPFIQGNLFKIISKDQQYLGLTARDLSEKKKSEEELRKHRDHLEELVEVRTRELLTTEARLQTLSDNLPGGAIFRGYTDEQGMDHMVYASKGIKEITGFSSEQLKENMLPFFDRIQNEDRIHFMDARAYSQKNISTFDIVFRYKRMEDEIRWLQLRTLYARTNDETLWWDGYAIDITDRKQAEEQSKQRDIIFRNLQELIAPVTGEKLFDTLLLNIEEILHTYSLFVAEYIPESRILRTLSFSREREIHGNFEYLIKDSPSAKILSDGIVAFKRNIALAFPKDLSLVNERIDGYVGVSLTDSAGKSIGVMVAASRSEIPNLDFAVQILQVFSVRIGAELIRMQKDRELQEREQRFSTLFDLSPNMQIITGLDSKIIEANSTFLQYTGLSRDEVIGRSTVELKLWDKEDSMQLNAEFNKNGMVNNFAAYFIPKKGKKRHVLLSLAAFSIKGQPYIISTGVDITERIMAEQKLAESEEKFRLIVEGQSDLIIKLDADKNFIFASPSYCEFFNKKEEELIGMNYLPVIHQDDLEATRMSIEKLYFIPHASSVEHRVETPAGWKWLAWSNKAETDEEGVLTGIISVGRDITEKKVTEEAMRISEERFRSILQNLSDSIWIVDINTVILYESPSAVNMLGYKPGELQGKKGIEMVHPEDVQEVIQDFIKAVNNKDDGNPTLFRVMTASGQYIYVEAISNNQIQHPAIKGIIITLRNVTERIFKDKALRESEQKFRNIFNNSTDAIIISSFDQKILEVNEVVVMLSGYSRDELLSKRTTDLATEKSKQVMTAMFSQIANNEIIKPIEVDFMIHSGEILTTEMTSRLIDYEGNTALLTLIRDITERKKLEKILIETIIQTEEKERERMAADLHDEVGPLLSSMKMYLNSLVETKDSSKSLYITDQLQLLIKESITAVREISNDLSPHILNNYGLSAAIRSTVEAQLQFIKINLMENLENKRFSQNIEIIFYRIIRELINNTIKHAAAKQIDIRVFHKEGRMILYYSDDGNGFDWQLIMNSTRKGLGLMNILSRVKSINGHYSIQTSFGKGFYFELTAPL